MTAMTQSELETFLKAPRHAIVGTNQIDGPPQLSPVWYIYDDDRLYISVGPETAKYRNLQRDPRISVCIDGGHPDARAVMIYGTAEFLEADDASLKDMRWRIIRHYYETEAQARQYADQVRDLPFVILVVNLEKVISQDFN
jgi:PPOX class probable F420-dependent enzyme